MKLKPTLLLAGIILLFCCYQIFLSNFNDTAKIENLATFIETDSFSETSTGVKDAVVLPSPRLNELSKKNAINDLHPPTPSVFWRTYRGQRWTTRQ